MKLLNGTFGSSGILLALTFLTIIAMASSTSVITSGLAKKLENGGTSKAVIVMAKNTQEAIDEVEAQGITDRNQKADAVTKALQKLTEESQKPVVEFLKKNNIKYDTFWISNQVIVDNVTLDTLKKIEALGGIKEIREEATATILG